MTDAAAPSTGKSWFYRLIATEHDWAPLVARVFLGAFMFPHGAQKLFGWFGGGGFSATMEGMSKGFPKPVVFLVIMAESLGALGLILGFIGRFCAFGVGLTM